MIIKLKDDFKEANGGYWKAIDVRDDIINKNKHSEFIDKIAKQMFAVNDINKLKQILEDEIFYEKILTNDIIKFHNSLQLGELTVEEFINEYNIAGDDGFVSVGRMLEVLWYISRGGFIKYKST